MADYVDLSNDAILPDDFDPNSENYDIFAGEATTDDSILTTEQSVESDGQAVTEGTEQEATTPPEATEPAPMPTIKVRFNHEDRELSYDEAAMYAQKGMNYDKLEQKVQAYDALNAKMTRLAKDLEYDSAEEMIDAAANNFRERQIRQLVEAGNTEAMARFLVDQQMKATYAETAPSATPTQEVPSPAPNDPAKDARRAEIEEFVRAYPGVTKLPDEVIMDNRNGVRLLVAYERYQNKAAQKELAILKQNQAAAAKAPVTGTVGKAPSSQSEADDPFLKGFNSDY